MRYRNTALAAFLLAAASVHAQDINGIALGSNINEAKDKIQALNKNYQITEQTYENKNIAELSAVDGANKFVVAATSDGKVWFLYKKTLYPSDMRPSFDKVKQAIIDKYGKPSAADRDASMVWAFSPSGKQGGNPHRTPFTCVNMLDKMNNPFDSFIPGEVYSDCGVAIQVETTVFNEMVNDYTITIAASKSTYDEWQKEAADAKAKQQQRIEAEKNKTKDMKIDI